MSQKPMYPLSCDLHPENRFDSGMALIHGPDHAAVATVVVQMEGDSSDRPDLLELAERIVLCYNAVPPTLVSTGALRRGQFNAEDAIGLACEANHREWLVTEELDALRVELSDAVARAAIHKEEARIYRCLLNWTVLSGITLGLLCLAVQEYPSIFEGAYEFIKGLL